MTHTGSFSAYADDLLNFLRNLTSIRETLQELASFKLVSGLGANLDKTELMPSEHAKIDVVDFDGHVIKWVEEMTIVGTSFNKKGVNAQMNFTSS